MERQEWTEDVEQVRVTISRLPPYTTDGTYTHEIKVVVRLGGMEKLNVVQNVCMGMMTGSFDRYWWVLGETVKKALKEGPPST